MIPDRAKRWILAATILASSMAFIDGSVVAVALPAIQGALATSVRGAQWIANAYMLTLGALILVGGAAGDRYGRRRMFNLGIGVFIAASIACGLAPNVGTLIAARALQGVGGALMVPESLAIISAVFPENERGKGHRYVGRVLCVDDSTRPGSWRMAGRHIVLAHDLFRQRAAGPHRVDHLDAPHA